MCVLDFYVVEGHQRGGLGLGLFGAMLRCEAALPNRLGYDRPSPKLIGFLRPWWVGGVGVVVVVGGWVGLVRVGW